MEAALENKEAAPEGAGTQTIFRPQPWTIEETGLDAGQCFELTLKTLRYGGRLSGGEIANRLRLSFKVIEGLLNFLKREKLIETVGAGGVVEQQYEYSLTDKGHL